MSLKPTKKSDADKDWMLQRKRKVIRIKPEYHLIVTEGTDTEPLYFQKAQEKINALNNGKIQLEVLGKGNNTRYLFMQAVQSAQSNPNIYRHVWVVFDTDDFPAEDIDQVDVLCSQYSTDETEYHSVWSNQCFELWFLLHFSYMHSDLHRSEYWDKISEWLNAHGHGRYRKNRTDMFEILYPHIDTAISNAKKLAELNRDRAPSKSAPGTKVYELMECLRPYI